MTAPAGWPSRRTSYCPGASRDVSICLTVLGRALAPEVVLRSGASAGDGIYLGREVGASAAGLHLVLGGQEPLTEADRAQLLEAHLQPRPQLELGRLLGKRRLASAMIDVSDGVLQDLGHICLASSVGAEVDADALPLVPAACRLAGLAGQDAIDWGLTGGEDYCLLFCVPAALEAQARDLCQAELGLAIQRIGQIEPGTGVRVRRAGTVVEAGQGGWDHFSSD